MPPILQNIANKWFLFEPALFAILFSHRLTANEQMLVPFRVGQMWVEYNPLLLAQMATREEEVEELLRYEMFRILLGHPYMRQPEGAQKEVLTLASNCVIGDNYAVGDRLFCPTNHRNLCFEEYYALLREEYSKPNGKGDDKNEEKSPQNGQPTEDDATSNGEDAGKGSDDESVGEDGQDKNEGTSEGESQDADSGQNSQAQPSSEQLASQSELWEEDGKSPWPWTVPRLTASSPPVKRAANCSPSSSSSASPTMWRRSGSCLPKIPWGASLSAVSP